MLKKLDVLVLISFFPPFIMAFVVVEFVFIMQFIYLYIDELIGKGLEWYIVAQLITYLSANTVPMSLPVAIMMGALMSFGNMGERYELSAMKSAGVPIVRFMMPQIVVGILLAVFSLLWSDMVVPKANLKFYTTLSDVSAAKPALNIKEDTYYKDLENYVIKVDSKAKDNEEIYGVYIQDNSDYGRSQDIITASRGRMFSSQDSLMVMKLYDGVKYQRLPRDAEKPNTRLHLRTIFREMEKTLDVTDLSLKHSGEDKYKDHYYMFNIGQLQLFIDSMYNHRSFQIERFHKNNESFFLLERDSTAASRIQPATSAGDTTFVSDLDHETKYGIYKQAALLSASIRQFAESPFLNTYTNDTRYIHRAGIELWRKLLLAVACLIFLFIGAPLGTVIRKGGIGLPMLISIVFYLVFIIAMKIGENLAKEPPNDPGIYMWLPAALLLPFAIYITILSVQDSNIMYGASYVQFFNRIKQKLGLGS